MKTVLVPQAGDDILIFKKLDSLKEYLGTVRVLDGIIYSYSPDSVTSGLEKFNLGFNVEIIDGDSDVNPDILPKMCYTLDGNLTWHGKVAFYGATLNLVDSLPSMGRFLEAVIQTGA